VNAIDHAELFDRRGQVVAEPELEQLDGVGGETSSFAPLPE
jgi:hypothetical protein